MTNGGGRPHGTQETPKTPSNATQERGDKAEQKKSKDDK